MREGKGVERWKLPKVEVEIEVIFSSFQICYGNEKKSWKGKVRTDKLKLVQCMFLFLTILFWKGF